MLRKNSAKTLFFDMQEFGYSCHYGGSDLGCTLTENGAQFKLWAPTATDVFLNIYEEGDGGAPIAKTAMQKEDKGVWTCFGKGVHGKYYTYTVKTASQENESADPYGKSTGINGERSMVIDLNLTNPEGWEEDSFISPIRSYNDAIIWEVHVRDFSNKIDSSKYKGKFLAFTETGLKNENGLPVGVDYLKNLGITHVHLLPIFDFATVDESEPNKTFNWGYDPLNYNTPEGSYSTDAKDGAVRVRELKEAILALHKAGIGVIMDVVYNHTYDLENPLNKTVPDYYYRFDKSGKHTNASACGNDTASERYMFRKFMVESVKYWLTEYHLDGFRFDLMGLHDLETMAEIERVVHGIKPSAIIYGEAWDMGTSMKKVPLVNIKNIASVTASNNAAGGIAVFSDSIRDGLKGGVFDETEGGYINGNAKATAEKVKSALAGKSEYGAQFVNYMSAHDNHTLWDKLLLTNPESSDAERLKMNLLGATVVMLSKGTPFMQGGEEMLRTKNGDSNSYKSCDAVNNIDWSKLKSGSLQYKSMLYYKGLIEIRKAFPVFSCPSGKVEFTDLEGGAFIARYYNDGCMEAILVLNPTHESFEYKSIADFALIADGENIGLTPLKTFASIHKIPPKSACIYVKM